jgi:iron complex outermembrane receptor protein
MQESKPLAKLAFCVAFLASCLSVKASPNEPTDDFFDLSLEDLMDMKVTVASLFEESALDVASSVSVITKEEWSSRGSRRLGKVLEEVPSVHSTTTWGGTETIAIRGYATELSVRGVAFSLDEVPLNSYVYAATYDKPIIELDFLDRIEMIRGPGSALYGTDAFHGVVSYKLDQRQGDYIHTKATLGDPLYQQASLTSGYQLSETQVNFGLATRKEDNHDLTFSYTDPIDGSAGLGSRDQAYENTSVYLSFTHGSIEQGKTRFNAYWNNFNSNEFQGIGTQFFQAIPTVFDVKSSSLAAQGDLTGNNSDFALTSLSYEKSIFNDLIIKAQAYYWKTHQDLDYNSTYYPTSLTTLSGTTLPCKSSADSPNPNPIYCPHTILQFSDEDRIGSNIHLKQKVDKINTQWVLGAGFDQQAVNSSQVKRVSTKGTISQFYQSPYHKDSRYIRHAFIQAKTSFLDETLHFVYGLRWDDYSDVGSHSSPRLGAIYNITPSLTTKLMYGHAFRAPTAIENKGTGTTVLANSDIKPETIDTYEWAIIHSTNSQQTELVLFTSHWDDAIVLVPSGQGISNIYKNVNNNHSWGVELTHKQFINQWQITLNTSYIESTNETDDLDYEAFPSIIANAGLAYTFKDQQKLSIWQRAMWNYTQADPSVSVTPEDAGDYFRTDLHYEYPVSNQISVFSDISNVFNRKNILPSYYGSEGGLPDYGRWVSIGVEVNWL